MASLKNSIYLLFLLFAVLLPCEASSLDSLSRVAGLVYDKDEGINVGVKYGLTGAYVTLIMDGDSLSTLTNDGRFSFKPVRPGKARIRTRIIGYTDSDMEYDFAPGECFLYIPLSKEILKLKGATVTAEVPPVVAKGDTLVFNAAAYRVEDGAYARELVEQLPGASFSGGKLLIFGNEIKRTYVNGILVYGNDPGKTLDYLKADEITSIEVYDEQSLSSREKGLKVSDKETVMDIKTRNSIVSAYDIHAIAATGADIDKNPDGDVQWRYHAGATANFFSEQLLLYGNAYTDNAGYATNSLMRFASAAKPLESYNEKTVVSAGIEKYWGDRLLGSSLRCDYSFGKDYTANSRSKVTEFKDVVSAPYAIGTSSSGLYGDNHAHNLSSDLIMVIPGAGQFRWIGTTDYSTDDSWSHSSTNQGNYIQDTEKSANRRKWSTDQSISYSNSGISSFYNLNVTFGIQAGNDKAGIAETDTSAVSYIKRDIFYDRFGLYNESTLGGSIEFYLLNKPGNVVTVTVEGGISDRFERKENPAFNIAKDGARFPNSTRSYDYSWNTLNTSGRTLLKWNTNNTNLLAAVEVDYDRIKDEERVPKAGLLRKGFLRVEPMISLHSGDRFNRGKVLDILYGIKTRTPGPVELRQWVDDSDLLFLLSGNSSLVAEKRHSLTLSRKWIGVSKTSFYDFQVNASYGSDMIVPKVSVFDKDSFLSGYDYTFPAGSYLSSFDNLSGAWSAGISFRYTGRFQKAKLNLNIFPDISYSRTPQFFGQEVFVLGKTAFTGMAQVRWSPSRKFWMSVMMKPVISFETMGISSNLWRLGGDLSANLEWNFAPHAKLSGYYSFYGHIFPGSDMDGVGIHNLNVLISYSFLKDRLTVGLSGCDLLHKGTSYSIATDAYSISRSWEPSYGRYLLLTLSWRFGKTSGTNFLGRLMEG